MAVGMVYGYVLDPSGVAINGGSVSAPGHTVVNNGKGYYYYYFTNNHTCSATGSAPAFNPQTKQFDVVAGTYYRVDFNLTPV